MDAMGMDDLEVIETLAVLLASETAAVTDDVFNKDVFHEVVNRLTGLYVDTCHMEPDTISIH